jgi:seryl-tRNA synthetase
MLDLKLLRDEPDRVRAALARRGTDRLLDDVLAADEQRRDIVHKVDEMKHEQNVISKQMARASADERASLLERARSLKSEIDVLEPKLRDADEHLERLASMLPNLPHESVPQGDGDEDNVELRRWGEPARSSGEDHLDIGRRLGVIDIERAARGSGARFGYLMNGLVYLEFALVRFAMDTLAPHGFVPVLPPVPVRREAMFGAGELPGDEAQLYYLPQDDLYLTGTSEQSLVALHMDETLEEAQLPVRYMAFSTCFRREAGTYGKDTRGIFRVHQFDKIEMFSYTSSDASWEEHEFLLARQEELLQAIGLPYRVVNVCTGEMGKKAAKQYDIEVWFPGQGRYRELTSCSNCTDYQSRRARIRVKGKPLPHTLNGTAFAIGRTIVAILESFQQDVGSVAVPKVLHPYMPEGMTEIGSP